VGNRLYDYPARELPKPAVELQVASAFAGCGRTLPQRESNISGTKQAEKVLVVKGTAFKATGIASAKARDQSRDSFPER